MPKIACAYIRVSTADQEEYSPDAQIRLLKEYAKNNDMVITDIYQDLGISGRKADKRPEFQTMIGQCKSKDHPYDAILVWKFSRFARNQEESIVYKSLLKKNNVDVISVSEPLPDGFIGELVERIFEWMDEYYSIRLSGEVKRGMTQKALSGGYNGNPPCGYKKEKGPDTIPYIDGAYADMVRMCFHLYVNENKSFADIAYIINAKGYRTRRGRKWESRNIIDMIQNPFYIGKIRWNYTENRARKLSGETIIVDGKHEPLIDLDTFNQANQKYKQMSATQNHGKRTILSEKHWLSGMLKCSACGASLAYQRGYNRKKNVEHPHFVCYRHVKGMCDCRNSITAAKAEHDVMEGLKDLIGNDTIAYLDPIPAYQPSKDHIEKQIESLRNRLNRLREAFLSGIDTIDEYKENKARIEAEIVKLETEYYEEQPAAPEPVTPDRIKDVYEFIESSDSMVDRATALREIVDHIVYDKESDTMKFYLK